MLIIFNFLQKVLKKHKSVFLNNTAQVIIKNNCYTDARKIINNLFNFNFNVDKNINKELIDYNIEYNRYLQTLIRSKLPLRYLFYQVLNNKFYKNKSIIYPIFFGIINKKKNLKNFFLNYFNLIMWYFFCFFSFLKYNFDFFLGFKVHYKDKKKIKLIFSEKKKIVILQSNNNIFSEKLLNWIKDNESSYFPIFLNNNLKNNIFCEDYAILKDNNFLYYGLLNVRFILKIYFSALIKTLFNFIFLLNWKRLLTFNEFLELTLFKEIRIKKKLKYLILFIANMHKPLWTFEANKKGIDTFLIFNGCTNEINSVNNELILSENDNWNASSISYWDQFYTWNSYHHNFLNKYFPSKNKKFIAKKYLIMGASKRQQVKKDSIILFPHDFNNSFYGFEKIMQYYNSNKKLFYIFHENIKKIALYYNMNIIVKLKKINSWTNIDHIKYIKNFCNNENIILADLDCDIEYLIKDSVGTISMPSTSASIITHELGIKNAIYDPLNYVNRNDNCLFGLKLLTNLSELDNYIKELKC